MECPYCDELMGVRNGEWVCPICSLAIGITPIFEESPQTKLSFFLKSLYLSKPTHPPISCEVHIYHPQSSSKKYINEVHISPLWSPIEKDVNLA